MILAKENILQDIARIIIWYPFRWLTQILPPRINFALFEMIGDLVFHLYPGKRAHLRSRISGAFSDWPAERVTEEIRACFRNYYADRFIINLVPGLDNVKIEQIATLEGEEHLKKTMSEGRGVVLVHSHFGPSQLPLIYLGFKGYPMAQIGFRKISERTIARSTDTIRLKLEYMMPVKHFFADRYLREVLRWLEEGKILMTAGDGTGGGQKIGKFHQTELLGRLIEMPLGPYRLASSGGSPIVPVIALREKCGFYRIRIAPPLNGGTPELIQKQFAAWFETHLSRSPGQWHFWDEWDQKRKED
jgi:lauroyl/myristoyl acyltransferase